jgi:hypothetical protein
MHARILRGKVVNSLARSRRAGFHSLRCSRVSPLNPSTFAAMMAATWLNQVCFARNQYFQAYPGCRKGSNDQATDRGHATDRPCSHRGAYLDFDSALLIFAIPGFGIFAVGEIGGPAMPPGGKPTHWGSDYGIFFDADDVWEVGSDCEDAGGSDHDGGSRR